MPGPFAGEDSTCPAGDAAAYRSGVARCIVPSGPSRDRTPHSRGVGEGLEAPTMVTLPQARHPGGPWGRHGARRPTVVAGSSPRWPKVAVLPASVNLPSTTATPRAARLGIGATARHMSSGGLLVMSAPRPFSAYPPTCELAVQPTSPVVQPLGMWTRAPPVGRGSYSHAPTTPVTAEAPSTYLAANSARLQRTRGGMVAFESSARTRA